MTTFFSSKSSSFQLRKTFLNGELTIADLLSQFEEDLSLSKLRREIVHDGGNIY